MTRAVPASLGVGVAALLCIALLSLVAPGPVMPSYLAAWLFWLALPAGALPLVMAFDLAASLPDQGPPVSVRSGAGEAPPVPRLPLLLLPALRLLLVGLPLVALLAIPVLFAQPGLFGQPGPFGPALPPHGFAAGWHSPGARGLRVVAVLLALSALALLFLRPGRPRALAAFGLVVHLAAATLLAMDLAMAVAPGLNSAAYGLVLVASQCGIAFSAAVLLTALPPRTGPAATTRIDGAAPASVPASVIAMLLWLLAAWMFLQFNQYLVVWSANLPREILWYQQRDAGLGRAAEWLAAFAFGVPLLAATVPRLARSARVLACLAGLVLLMHLVETLWLVTPSFRGAFTLSLADLLGLAGIGGLACALLLAARGRGQGVPA